MKPKGRPPKPYRTKVISFRIREEWLEELRLLVWQKVEQLKQQAE